MTMRALFTSLLMMVSTQAQAGILKTLDGAAAYCGQTNNLVQFPKVLKIEVVEQIKAMDVAEATLKISLKSDACEDSGLDPAPRTYGTINVKEYVVTVTDGVKTLYFKQTLEKLLTDSVEEVNFGVPRSVADSDITFEIGVQFIGDVSENREMFQPHKGNFGVFNFKFDKSAE
jgi:hypothetical protein